MRMIRVSERNLNVLLDTLLQDFGTHQRLKVSDRDSYEYHSDAAFALEEQIKSLFTDLLKES